MAGGAGGLVRASEMEGGEGSAVGEKVWSTKMNQFAFYSQSTVLSRRRDDICCPKFYVVLMEVLDGYELLNGAKDDNASPKLFSKQINDLFLKKKSKVLFWPDLAWVRVFRR